MNDCSAYQVIIPAAGSSTRIAHMTRDCPKSLLEINGRSIIHRSLDILEARGFRRVTFVVGYMRELFMQTLGDRHGKLSIEYVVSEDYATTERGWSLYLTRNSWNREKRPVVFMDADNIYEPAMLDLMMASKFENVVLVDDAFTAVDRDEELVVGRDSLISGLVRGVSDAYPNCLGGFVGINRFSAAFMDALYPYMEDFSRVHGPRFAYERVFHRFLHETGVRINYLLTGRFVWVNVNHEAEYRDACQRVETFDTHPKAPPPPH